MQNCNQIVVNAISTSTLMEVTNLSKKYLGFYNYASKLSIHNLALVKSVPKGWCEHFGGQVYVFTTTTFPFLLNEED